MALQWRFSVLEKKSIKLEVEITILIYRGLDQDLSAENVDYLQLCGWREAQSVSIIVT